MKYNYSNPNGDSIIGKRKTTTEFIEDVKKVKIIRKEF